MKSTVKVFVSLLLVVGMLVCLGACGGKKGPSGVYELERVKIAGIEMDAKEAEMDMTFEFLGDGKGVSVYFDDEEEEEEKTEFKYDDKTITMIEDGDETVMNYKLDGKTLTLSAEEDGETVKMIFKKK